MHIAGLVLARGGSKGIPLKNLARLRGTPLLLWALKVMTRCRGFHSIWVSSDHPEILATALKNDGVQVHQRSAATSTDDASSVDAIREFLACHPEVDVVGLIQCTSPFIRTEELEEAVEKMNLGLYDSIFSVTRSHCLRWKEDSTDGSIRAVNFQPERRPRRQDWRGDLVETGAFYFATASLLRQGLLQGGRISFVEVSGIRSIDIDSSFDLWLAEKQATYFGLEPGGVTAAAPSSSS